MSVSLPRGVADTDAAFYQDVVKGLSQTPKRLPCKYFYDKRGSELFDRICELDEYYLTRTETEILHDRVDEVADRICERPVVFELGSGSSVKTRILLDRLRGVEAYVPMDISGEHLEQIVEQLHESYPDLRIYPLVADYTQPYRLPEAVRNRDCVLAFFPGSTIGNFKPADAVDFLRRVHDALPAEGYLLIGVDLLKDPVILERAYNDSDGITAEFNKNLLRRINHELGGNFPLDAFEHRAVVNPAEARVEMHLVATRSCTVRLGRLDRFSFERGETIHTENSYKYTLESFEALAEQAGFAVRRFWTDSDDLFSVHLLARLAA